LSDAFTVGHSITLSLVTLGSREYPVALVEFAIALSIFLLAVEPTRTSRRDMLWRNPQPATRNPQPATRNPQPATRNPQPATRNPQPATRNP
jgi:hypothetical protein